MATQITKPLVAIVGPSGSGKSSSLRNLNPADVVILDGEQKGFPFKGAERYRVLTFSSPAEFTKAFDEAIKLAPKYIIIESLTKLAFQMKTLCSIAYKGYDIWTNYSKMVRTRLNQCKNVTSTVVFTAIDEIVELPQADGSNLVKRMICIEGQELKKQGGIEPDMLVIFFTDVRKDATGKIVYSFETNNDGVTTAKSPAEMFSTRYIPNDLNAAMQQLEAYYTTSSV